MHGQGWGAVPDWYADLHGAQYAGVPWPTFEGWPLWRKARVWAAMTAESAARKEQERAAERS